MKRKENANTVAVSELITKAMGERTQNQFAMHCGISSAALSRYRKGQRVPQSDELKRIATKAYNGVTYEQLMAAAGYLESAYFAVESDNIEQSKSYTGQILKKEREKRGLSQRNLSLKTGISNATISRIENKNVIPDTVTLEKLANFFGVSPLFFHGHLGNVPSGVIEGDSLLDTEMRHLKAAFEVLGFDTEGLTDLPKQDQKFVVEQMNALINKLKGGKNK